MFNKSFKQMVLECLDYKALTMTEFFVEESDKRYGEEIYNYLYLFWLADKTYFYRITASNQKKLIDGSQCFEFKVEFSPGEVTTLEKEILYSDRELTESIKKWLDFIQSEAFNSGSLKYLKRKLDEQENIIRNIDDKLSVIEENSFTDDEEEQINKRLDEFKAEITKLLDENEEKNKKELKKMSQEIEILRSMVNQLDKKNWIKLFAIKFLNWSKDPANQKILIAGAKVVQQTMPNDIKDMLSIEQLK